MLHRLEITEGIGVGEGAVFAEAFLVVAALCVMETTCIAAVVTGIESTFVIEFDAECVSASLSKNFVNLFFRVITPDQLPQRLNGFLVFLTGLFDFPGNGTSLGRVKPAVRPPAEAVDNRVCVFQAEAFEVHHGIAVGNIIVILVWIKQ